jgi:hypothetical protein
MTEEELKRAARILCERQGLDPDEEVSHGGHSSATSPRWQFVRQELRVFAAKQEALAAALAPQPAEVK